MHTPSSPLLNPFRCLHKPCTWLQRTGDKTVRQIDDLEGVCVGMQQHLFHPLIPFPSPFKKRTQHALLIQLPPTSSRARLRYNNVEECSSSSWHLSPNPQGAACLCVSCSIFVAAIFRKLNCLLLLFVCEGSLFISVSIFVSFFILYTPAPAQQQLSITCGWQPLSGSLARMMNVRVRRF